MVYENEEEVLVQEQSQEDLIIEKSTKDKIEYKGLIEITKTIDLKELNFDNATIEKSADKVKFVGTYKYTTISEPDEEKEATGQIELNIKQGVGVSFSTNGTELIVKIDEAIIERIETIEGQIGGIENELQAVNEELAEHTNKINQNIENIGVNSANIQTLNNKLVNDYYTKISTYSKEEVNELIGAIKSIEFEVVAVLPTHDIKTNVIYLVPATESKTKNIYDEFVYINGNWEQIGTTAIDLSNYYTKTETNNNFASKTYVDGTFVKATGEDFSVSAIKNGVTKVINTTDETLNIEVGTSEEQKSTILLASQGMSVVGDNVTVASSNVENGFAITNEQMDLFGNVKLNEKEIATKDEIVQSDWNETDETKKSYILNKPTIPEGSTIYQEKGQNTDGAMSQKATTDELNKLDEKIKDLELFKFPNATIVGEPTISNGQVSDFTNQDYLQFPFIVDLRNKPFEIQFAYTTDDNVTTQQNILDSYFGLALAIQNGKGIIALSSNGNNWDIGTATGNYAIQPNTTYYVKLIWNGSVYKTYIGTDENNLVEDITLNSTLAPYPRTVFIGGSYGLFGAGTDHRFYGTINMNKALLKVQDIVVWTGMDDVGISSRADVSLSNIDEAGKQVIKNQTQPQIDVINQVIGDIDEEISSLNSAVANKQGKLTQPQLDATNSGITQTKVAEYDTVKQQYLKNATIDNQNHLTITKQDNTTVVFAGGSGSGGTTVTVGGVAQETWDADTKADKTTVQNQGTIINSHTTSISNLQNNKADKSEIPTDYVTFEEDEEVPEVDPLVALKQEIFAELYPVGSEFITENNADYSNRFGFTWERLAEGYALWTANSGAGDMIGAGLPNIEGSMNVVNGGLIAFQMANQTGAFYGTNSVLNKKLSITTQIGLNYPDRFNFDASLSNSIYGNSDTVQPPARKVYVWKRVN